MKKRNRKFMSSLLALTLLLPAPMISASGRTGSPAVTLKQAPQTRMPDYTAHWAKRDFQTWVDKGLISGYGDGTYKPEQKITRAEWMSLINRAFNLQREADAEFKDVSADDAYYHDIRKAVAAGYISGYDDRTLRPGQTVSRQEAAVMLFRLFGLESGASGEMPKDIADVPAWCRDAVLALLSEKYLSGYGDGSFKGNRQITRAEALRMIDGLAGEIIGKAEPLRESIPGMRL